MSMALMISCTKEESTITPVDQNSQPSLKLSGAKEDDPELVAKIPTIISSDFVRTARQNPAFIMAGRGKPKPTTGTTDITPPTVSITSPGNGSSLSGVVNVQAIANDNVGLRSVDLSVDGIMIQSLNSAPFNFSWNSANSPNGSHTITVTATDLAGNSRNASVSVSTMNSSGGDATPPSITIISPTNNSSIVGQVDLESMASDNVGVSLVSYNVNGQTIGTSASSPYRVSWNPGSLPNGIYSLTATARDAAGNIRSHTIQVSIGATVLPASSLPLSYQLTMPPVMNQGTEGSCVAFAVVYAARSAEQFYRTNSSSYTPGINMFSPEYIFNQVNWGGDCSSSAVVPSLDLMKTQGVCTWQSMPYSTYNGCSLMPNTTQLNEAANYRISSYSTVVAMDETAIKSMIVSKHPVIATVNIDNQFYNATPGFIWNSWTNNSGFHGITICGYDDTRHAYKAMNSWGTNWGDAGYIWIDYDFFPTVSSYYCYIIGV